VQPIYVSPGHLIDLEGALDLALRCDGGYRQPEPTRRAHLLVNALRRGERKPTSEVESGEKSGGGTEGQGTFDF
jgi:deoxyribonuclease V